MHRQDVISLLEQYQPSAEEDAAKAHMINFITRYPNCFERSLSIGHITVSTWLLNTDHSKALLMHHTKLDKWMQLGGHCDGDADVYSVARKEAQEESGITHIALVMPAIFDIDIHYIPARTNEPEHYHYDIRFLAHVTSDESFVQNHESKELRWIDKDGSNMPPLEQSVRRMFDKWRALAI